jgi:hypothetical protein
MEIYPFSGVTLIDTSVPVATITAAVAVVELPAEFITVKV